MGNLLPMRCLVACFCSLPSSEARCAGKANNSGFTSIGTNESGFGGRADEKIQAAREAPPVLGRKKSYPQHLTIARGKAKSSS